VIEAPTGGDSTPRRGRSRRTVGSAPGSAPGVLVVRSDGCVMSRQPAHDAEALTSRATPPVPYAVRRNGNKGYFTPGCRRAYSRRPGPRGRCGRNSMPIVPLSTPP
jgi:hypothetical protein